MALDLRISLKKLELFVLVAELGSIRRAAEQVFVTQPVVTGHMQDLGERLGIELFAREGNHLVLTEQGRLALQWARSMLAQTHELARRLEETLEGTSGSAAVATSMTVGSYLLPDVVRRFKQERPGAAIKVSVFDLERVVQSVESGQHDFGVVLADDVPCAAGTEVMTLGHEELVLVGPTTTGTPSESAVPLNTEPLDLARLQLVASPERTARQELVDRLLREHGLQRPPVAVELGSAEAMKRAVRGGLGVAFLFRSSVAEELERGVLQELPLPGVGLRVPLHLVRRADRALSPLQSALIDAIRKAVSDEERD